MGFFDRLNDPGNQTPPQTYDELYNDSPQVEPGIRDGFDTTAGYRNSGGSVRRSAQVTND
jgi:hypothetical protein